MDFKIRYSKAALADLDEILAYSWAQFPNTTEKFGAAIVDQIERLASFPYLGAPVFGRPGRRVLVHKPILIKYSVYEDDCVVEILEIRHSSRR